MRRKRIRLKKQVKVGIVVLISLMVSLLVLLNIKTEAIEEETIEIPTFEKVNVEILGIDVSKWDGIINWELVKEEDSVEFAIIRCAYSTIEDTQWKYNADECTKLEIPFDTYLYSYATSPEEAKEEAKYVLKLIKGYDIGCVYLDMEDELLQNLTSKELGTVAESFCNEITAAGYKVGIYSSTYWFNNILTDEVFDKYPKWCAQYNITCEYKDYDIWQYTDKGQVLGIDSDVDLNVKYETIVQVKE